MKIGGFIMGVTIHFQGTLKNAKMVYALVDELIDISKSMNWHWDVIDEDWSKPSTAKLSKESDVTEIVGHLSLKGISINLHPDCEPLSLFFNSTGRLTNPMSILLGQDVKKRKQDDYSFVKTQFAPPEVHITIVKLLKYLKQRYMPDLNVIDEGEYWQSEDKEKLIKKIAFLNDKMAEISVILSEMAVEAIEKSCEKLAAILEERLKKML